MTHLAQPIKVTANTLVHEIMLKGRAQKSVYLKEN